MAKRKNTLTRFFEDIVDDTKDLVDDVLDRAKDVEDNARDAAKDVVDDDGNGHDASVKSLHVAIEELTAKINQLAEAQLASAK
jgi:polyhydroxyalkanoate synthesis regulator phasin